MPDTCADKYQVTSSESTTMTRSNTRRAGILGGSVAALLLLAACGSTPASGGQQATAGTAMQAETAALSGPVTVKTPVDTVVITPAALKSNGLGEAEVSGDIDFTPDEDTPVTLTAGGKDFPVTAGGPYFFKVPGDGRDAVIKVGFKDRTQTVELATGKLDTAGVQAYSKLERSAETELKEAPVSVVGEPLLFNGFTATRGSYDFDASIGGTGFGWPADGKVWLRVSAGAVAQADQKRWEGGSVQLGELTLTGSDSVVIPARILKTEDIMGGRWKSVAVFEVPVDEAKFTLNARFDTVEANGAAESFSTGNAPMVFATAAGS